MSVRTPEDVDEEVRRIVRQESGRTEWSEDETVMNICGGCREAVTAIFGRLAFAFGNSLVEDGNFFEKLTYRDVSGHYRQWIAEQIKMFSPLRD